MRATLISFAFTTFIIAGAACGGSSGSGDANPNGNWALTLDWGSGTCSGLGSSFVIDFDISQNADGSYTFTPGNGSTGDDIGGTMDCTAGTTCTLSFTDTGPGDEESNIDTQTLAADLTEDNTDQVTGNGSVTFMLEDGTSCTQNFTGSGDVE